MQTLAPAKRAAWPALLVLLGGCAVGTELPPYDPLPELFPVQLSHPRNLAGWELLQTRSDPDPTAGLQLLYRGPPPDALELHVNVAFAGAFVDPSEAIAAQWPALVAQLDQLIVREQLQLYGTPSDRRRSIRPRGKGPEREGRSLRLQARDASGKPLLLVRDLFFVDPYVVSLSSRLGGSDHAQQLRRLDDLGAALISELQPDPQILCDPRVQVLKVRLGLSNVSSNGRVIFISTQTDHVDASTVAELQRAASRQRERAGCPALPQDFSALETRMKRRARVR